MVALKRKRSGQEYGEDEKLLHQVQGSNEVVSSRLCRCFFCHEFNTGTYCSPQSQAQANVPARRYCSCMLRYHLRPVPGV